MRLWFADSTAYARFYDYGARRMLISYATIVGDGDGARWIWEHPSDTQVFLDSGAFGVHAGSVKIDLPMYCDYVRSVADRVHVYASLDVIGDWRASARNYDGMRREGLTPIPTFHRGSPLSELERICKENHGYIALGGMAVRGHSKLEVLGGFLDGAFSVITKYWPLKVHAFGITGMRVLEQYPFYSADSTSAVLMAGMGRVLLSPVDKWHNPLRTDFDMHWSDYVVRSGDTRVMDKDGKSGRYGRLRRNVEATLATEAALTRLWAHRGVTWES